ncbi:unnamed protein product [Owenia fusiformis]|uniref:Uncharacterized protein n=1 Tax=Owenia fusiformis TaxID=6347 RepID=A0A8J1Y5E2_OWEFU|nr:unnamed protein product [Owenia fusiformis]
MARGREHRPRSYRASYVKEKGLIFAVIQLICGVASLVLAIAIIAIGAWGHMYGIGFWTGVLFVTAGVFGIVASNKMTKCTIVSFLILSVLANLITILLLVHSALGIKIDSNSRGTNFLHRHDPGLESSVIIIHAMMLVVAVTECAFSFCSIYICYRTICCEAASSGYDVPDAQRGDVHFLPEDPQSRQIMIVTSEGQTTNVYAMPQNTFVSERNSANRAGTFSQVMYVMPSSPGAVSDMDESLPPPPYRSQPDVTERVLDTSMDHRLLKESETSQEDDIKPPLRAKQTTV